MCNTNALSTWQVSFMNYAQSPNELIPNNTFQKVLSFQDISMWELNKCFPTKYEPTEGLLWHNLQTALIKAKGLYHNTVYWPLLCMKNA